MLIGVIITSGTLFAQTTPESRLNVGKEAKKRIIPASPTPTFGKMPEKLNFNSKNEFTQFYRNLLLNSRPENVAESAPARTAEGNTEKIRFGNMYPNPAIDFVEIPYDVVENFKDAHVTVMNMVGAPLLVNNISSGSKKIKVNTTNLDSGIYMVQFVVDGKKVGTKKLLVERN